MLIDLPGGWQLVPPTDRLKSLWPRYYLRHHHEERKGITHTNCMVYSQGGACNHCGEPMPDEISGLIQLLEWKR